jgi:hypothetical protein
MDQDRLAECLIKFMKGGYWNEEDHMEKAPLRKER